MIAAAAPAILETAPAATPAPATPDASAAGFDAILLLQNFAAAAESLDAANFEAGDTADLLSEDSSDDDESGDDLEASLAFLSALLTATTPKGSPGDFQAGQGGDEGSADDGPAPGLSAAVANQAFGLDADGAEKLDAALNLTAVAPETMDSRGAGDASQNLARAAELLGQRAAAAEVPKFTVATPVRDPRWADEVGARVSLMVRAGESTASLQLTPVDLGPVEVNVSVKDSQATIHFGASQAETRALLEASLPKLRELLAAQGFNLTDASVSSGFSRSQQQAFASGNRAGAEAETSTADARPLRQSGLLDLYA